MNSLLLLAGLGAGIYLLNKRSEGLELLDGAADRTLSAEEVQQLTPVQAKVEELVSSGQLVTEVKEIQTASGQKATVIIAPTPDVPNRAVVVDANDLARIQGRYIPKVTMTADLQEQMQYAGYTNFDEFIRLVAAGRVNLYGPAADRIKFPFADWEYWRTGYFDPNASVTNLATSPLTTLMTHPEYSDLIYRNGLDRTTTRLGGLGNWWRWQ